MSNVRFLSHAMPRTYKITLFCAMVLLLAFDVHAVAQRYALGPAEAIAWVKAVGAIGIQALALGAGAAYFLFLGNLEKSGAPVAGSLSWQVKLLPVLGLGVVAAFSVAMLYNGLVCGSQPLPSVRGVPLCGR